MSVVKTQKTSKRYSVNDQQPANGKEKQDQIKQQIKFIRPAKGVFVDPIPQIESRVRSSLSAVVDRPSRALHSGSSATLNPNREIPSGSGLFGNAGRTKGYRGESEPTGLDRLASCRFCGGRNGLRNPI